MISKGYPNSLIDLFYITDNKRVKAEEAGLFVEADQLSKTEDYIEDVICEEFNIKWND